MRWPSVAPSSEPGLRLLTAADWPLEQALSRDPLVVAGTSAAPDLTEEEARARVDRLLARRAAGTGDRWVVVANGLDVGVVGVRLEDEGWELGWALLPAGRGRGLASGAVRQVAETLLAGGAERVRALVLPGNAASRRVATRAGFEREGVLDRGGRRLQVWCRPPATGA